MNFVTRFFKDESGATAIEYGLIAAGMAVAVIAAITILDGALKNSANNVQSAVDTYDPA